MGGGFAGLKDFFHSCGVKMMDEMEICGVAPNGCDGLDDLVKKLSDPDVCKLGEEYNRIFNGFTVEEWFRPFDI